eukprot:144670-Rhodomonas_salina.1
MTGTDAWCDAFARTLALAGIPADCKGGGLVCLEAMSGDARPTKGSERLFRGTIVRVVVVEAEARAHLSQHGARRERARDRPSAQLRGRISTLLHENAHQLADCSPVAALKVGEHMKGDRRTVGAELRDADARQRGLQRRHDVSAQHLCSVALGAVLCCRNQRRRIPNCTLHCHGLVRRLRPGRVELPYDAEME